MSEFRYKPVSSDWAMPAEVVEKIDDLGLAVLSERDIEGIPIPLGFSFSLEMSKVIKSLDETDADPWAIEQEIERRFTEVELRYPEAPAWDRLRGLFVSTFLEHGHQDEAISLMWTMNSAHSLVEKMMDIAEATEGERLNEMLAQVMDQEESRKLGLIRAFRDMLIYINPISDLVEVYNNYLLQSGMEKDSVEGWVESQSKVNSGYDWSSVVETIKDDSLWGTMPTPTRQYMLQTYMEMQVLPEEDLLPDWAEGVIQFFDSFADEFPGSKIIDHFRGNLALSILKANSPDQALAMGRSVRDSGLLTRMALEFIANNNETGAIELAVSNPDHKTTVDILLDADWSNDSDQPVRKLEDIMLSDDYPKEKRIGCLEALRDRCFEAGLIDKAEAYNSRAEELRNS